MTWNEVRNGVMVRVMLGANINLSLDGLYFTSAGVLQLKCMRGLTATASKAACTLAMEVAATKQSCPVHIHI